MKTTESPVKHHLCLKQAFQGIRSLAVVSLVFCATSAFAAQLIWDPNQTGGVTPGGSGNWDTTAGNTFWYNGTGDVVWSQTSTTSATMGATFGGSDGTWAINVDAGQVATANITINNSGYTFSGGNIYMPSGDSMLLAAGKTATFDCNLSGAANGSAYWTLGSGSTMNIAGNITATSGGQEVRFGGPSSCAFYLSGNNTVAYLVPLAPVFITNGSTTISSTLYIGYTTAFPAPNAATWSVGSLTVTNATVTANANVAIIARSGGSGTLTIENGSSVSICTATTKDPLAICYTGTSDESGTVNLYGGTLTVGSSTTLSPIDFFDTSQGTGASSVMNLTNGTVNAWGGIIFGVTGSSAGTATLTQSGGTLLIGSPGITFGALAPNTTITLSGGTVGALANWSSSLPMTLATANGNITFQCADNNNTSRKISLSGALTDGGLGGGLNVAGGATLTLSGANNYKGSTMVSNGTLAVTAPMTVGPVTLDGSAGSPTVSVQLNPGQDWSVGTLTYQNLNNSTLTADFNFGALSPSTSLAPIQVTGNVAFPATPNVTVEGSSIPVGTYPLITCTGSISGTPPTTVTLTGSASVGSIQTVGKTISLVVTSSTYNPALTWAVGNGAWDIGVTENWNSNSSPAYYADGDAVLFNDSASGSSPITVTLNTPVGPFEETFNNTAKSYTISGTGSISGSGALSVLGGGTVTLAGANTYSGGTTLSAGQLNINNGGSASASAVGTGTLTIKNGTTIDNTSGSDVTLQPSISETWNGNFTYAGSANNFNTGPGQVTMSGNVTLDINAENLTVGGQISDNNNGYALTKTGNGTLTLTTGNSFAGGLTLAAGQLNLGDPGAAGTGIFTISGGSLDNSSGGQFTMSGISGYNWNGSFTYIGSSSLDLGLGYPVTVLNGLGTMTLTIENNTLINRGDIISGNTRVIKAGNGTWDVTGPATSANNLGLTINAGVVDMARSGGQTIGVGTIGLTINPGALAIDMNSYQIHSDTATTPVPVSLAGGTFDINGYNENIDEFSISGGGTLQDSGGGSGPSTINLISGHTASLTGTNCQFNITNSQTLNFNGPIGGSGTLVTIGAGTLVLASNNIYTGGTVISNGTVDVGSPAGFIPGNVSVLNNGTPGTLELDNPTSMSSSATLSVATGATAYLNYSGTQTIAVLYVGGIAQAPGIYGNSANNPGGVFTGTGTLTVSSGPPFSIFNAVISGNQLNISWNSVNGENYNVYTTTSLAPPVTWTKVDSSPIAGTGSVITYTVPGSVSATQQLYVTVMQY